MRGTGAELVNDASRWVLERFTGVSQAQTPVVRVSGDVLEQCVGVYRTPVEDVEVGRLGEALVARPIDRGGFPTRSTPPPADATPPLIRLGFYAEDRLVGAVSTLGVGTETAGRRDIERTRRTTAQEIPQRGRRHGRV